MNNIVSVIITTYRRPVVLLTRAVESVLTQTYQNLELIVVDDNGDAYVDGDKLSLFYESIHDRRFQVIKHKDNKGACAARNTGIVNSHGDYLAFLDDDDEWLPEKLEKQVSKIEQTGAGLVYCRYLEIDTIKATENIMPVCKLYRGHVFDHLIKENFVGSNSFPLFKRECVEKCGMCDEELLSAQDFDLWLRIASEYEIDYIDEPLVKYYIHGGGCITQNHGKRIQGAERIIKKNISYLKKHRMVYNTRLAILADRYLLAGEKNKAANITWKAIKVSPFSVWRNAKNIIKLIKGKTN